MSYRSINFRDGVLWAVARKLGLNPLTDLHQDEADSLVGYINAWVRRLWDSTDWNEWTTIEQRTPDVNHYVPYELGITPSLSPAPTEPPGDTAIGKVFKVYLADPDLLPRPLDTPFRLRDKGIHVGFEHGSRVWIKYIPPAPRFTAAKWQNGTTYKSTDLVYSTRSGECYKSLISNNVAVDPAGTVISTHLNSVVTQDFVPAVPAIPATSEVWNVAVVPPDWFNRDAITYQLDFLDEVGDTHTVLYVTPAAGGTVLDVLNGLVSAMGASSDPFITGLGNGIDLPNSTLVITRGTAAFSVSGAVAYYNPGVGPTVAQNLVTAHVSNFVPASPFVPAVAQITNVFLSAGQTSTVLLYTIKLTDSDGMEHILNYESKASESLATTILGIAAVINAAVGSDSFWGGVVVNLDIAGLQMELVTNQFVTVEFSFVPDVSAIWRIVPFPLALVEAVVRGAYADALREEGQTDKAQIEEQAVATEGTLRAAANTGQQLDVQTDQQYTRSRYGKGK